MDPAPGEARRIRRARVGLRKIAPAATAPPRVGVGTAAVPRRLRIDHADDVAAELMGERLDHPPHLPVTYQQNLEQVSTLKSQLSRPNLKNQLATVESCALRLES